MNKSEFYLDSTTVVTETYFLSLNFLICKIQMKLFTLTLQPTAHLQRFMPSSVDTSILWED